LRQASAQIQQLAEGSKQLELGLKELKSGVEKLGENLKVTTVDKDWGVAIFGSINGEMLFSESRPFLPSGVVFLFPDLGKDSQTFEAHGKSTNIGAALAGPEINGLRAGGTFLTYLYGEQFENDNYGFFIVRSVIAPSRNWRFRVSRPTAPNARPYIPQS
jgi:hypothetical protein